MSQSKLSKCFLIATEDTLKRSLELIKHNTSLCEKLPADNPLQMFLHDLKEIELNINHALTGLIIINHLQKPEPVLIAIRGGKL